MRRSDPINQVRVYRPSLSCVQGNDFWFCWTVRNWSLFLTHPADWNECMTSKNAQSSTRSRFWVLKISRKIGVLKQSQLALFNSVSHMTILFVFTCMMNVRDQTRQSFVTSFGPFRDRSCKFVHWLASLILNWCLAFTHHMWWCVFWYIRAPRIRLLRTRCWRRRRSICKNVSRYTMCAPNAWRPIFAARHSQRTAQHSTRIWMRWERHWLTGNVGLSTAYWFSILKIYRIIHTINFIL